jgi:hypothetical protein
MFEVLALPAEAVAEAFARDSELLGHPMLADV